MSVPFRSPWALGHKKNTASDWRGVALCCCVICKLGSFKANTQVQFIKFVFKTEIRPCLESLRHVADFG
jgi:hypothetical protein